MSDRHKLNDLREQSLAAAALIENFADILGDNEEAKSDIVEGETDLFEVVSSMVMRLAVLDSLIEGIDSHAAKLRARKSRMVEQSELIRNAIGSALDHAGVKRVETSVGTVSVKKVAPKLIVTEEADLPTAFLKTSTSIDKKALLAALKEGEEIPGATLSNGSETIQIRGS